MRPNVLAILSVGGLTKIAEPIVGLVAIDVIDLIGRPHAEMNGPTDTMGQIAPLAYNNANIPRAKARPGRARFNAATTFGAPMQMASLRVVFKELTEAVYIHAMRMPRPSVAVNHHSAGAITSSPAATRAMMLA